MYLQLFHGRHTPDEHLKDWGLDGPILGPLDSIVVTYFCHVRIFTGPSDDEHDLEFVSGLLHYDGLYYGDVAIITTIPDGRQAQPFEPLKAARL